MGEARTKNIYFWSNGSRWLQSDHFYLLENMFDQQKNTMGPVLKCATTISQALNPNFW